MNEVEEFPDLHLCDSCQQPADILLPHDGDRLCESCKAVFWTAVVLYENEIADEDEIITTIAFAARMRQIWRLNDVREHEAFAQEFVQKYRRFELIRVVDGVPLLRPRSVTIDVIRYSGTELPRKVLIEVFSRFVEPTTVARLYRQTLVEESIHFDEYTGGSVEIDVENAYLRILVGAKAELHSGRVGHFSKYPRGRIYSFPPPELVQGWYKALLGSADKRTFSGVAFALGDHGRPIPKSAEKTIPACVAWYVGECDEVTRPADRRPRVARLLNRHLLRPLEKPELPEDYWSNDDTVWRDAQEVSKRLIRAEYFLQQAES